MRQLIVNADDFGRCNGVNAGVIEAFEKGIVTSASLMVRGNAASEAAEYVRMHPELSLGIHIDLGEWIFRNGEWSTLYEVISRDDESEVRSEVAGQLDTFRRLMDREPTHLDSHQHVHEKEPAHSIIRELAERLRIPCRGYSAVRYCGKFYGQTATGKACHEAISVEALLNLIGTLPEGFTELACHPGIRPDPNTMYVDEREQEVRVLCDPRVKDAIEREKIALCSFHEAGVR
jgi:predicted glycoside hydrolase/deacetylase ChbG (UPF0249 family)